MQKSRSIFKLNLIVFLFFVTIDLYAFKDHTLIHYDVLIKPEVVDVDVRVSNLPKDEVLCFEYTPSSIANIRVKDQYHSDLKVSKDKPNIFCVHKVKGDIFVSFNSEIKAYKEDLDNTKRLSNVSLENTVIIHGSNLSIVPLFKEDKETEPSISLTLSTKGLALFMSNLGPQMEYNLKNPKDLYSSLFVAGTINNRHVKIKRTNYSYSFIGTWTKRLSDQIQNLYKTIVVKQYDLWDFIPINRMNVLFIKSKNIKQGHGFQYNNVIVYMLPENFDFKDIEFLKLLAHEHFHLWNGNYIKPTPHLERELLWFQEGVTNYYALITLVSAKIINEKVFLKHISDKYIKYDSSYENSDLFIAMALDLEIMKASSLKLNLDNLMKGLALKKEILSLGYNNQKIKEEIVTLVNWDVSSFFDKYINQKNKISVDEYFEYLGLRFSKDLNLIKFRETRSYKKWLSI